MRTLREQPRLVAAKLTVAVGALVACALVGAAIAREDPKTPPDLRPRLERSEQLRRAGWESTSFLPGIYRPAPKFVATSTSESLIQLCRCGSAMSCW